MLVSALRLTIRALLSSTLFSIGFRAEKLCSLVEHLQLARIAFSARVQRLTAAIAASAPASDASLMPEAASTASATAASSTGPASTVHSSAVSSSPAAAFLTRAHSELHSAQLQLVSLEHVRAAAVALFEVDTKARFIAQHAVFAEVRN
jgi:hypothetical protein